MIEKLVTPISPSTLKTASISCLWRKTQSDLNFLSMKLFYTNWAAQTFSPKVLGTSVTFHKKIELNHFPCLKMI